MILGHNGYWWAKKVFPRRKKMSCFFCFRPYSWYEMGYDKISIIMGLLIKALDTNADQLVFTEIIAT